MNFTRERLEEILEWHGTRPEDYIETGTMYGATARMASPLFESVLTIELSLVIAEDAMRRLADLDNVRVVQGNSGVMLNTIAPGTPAVFYLDAHGCKEPGTAGQGQTALWGELEYLRTRIVEDLIIIDDVHAFGGGADGPNPFWADVTIDTVVGAVDGRGVCRFKVFGDQFAMSCRV